MGFPFFEGDGQPRDPELIEIETQIRRAVRDAVNRKTRKPFTWGGLSGYQQLEVIAPALHQIIANDPENSYLRKVSKQVDHAIAKGRIQADDLKETHEWLLKIAACLRYPPSKYPQQQLTGEQVAFEMEALQQQFQPEKKYMRPQASLCGKLHRSWNSFGEQLLHCYDIPGLPPDNLQIESLFNRLRRHQRRISGRKSTRELREFGHCQVLFMAESRSELLDQIRQVPLSDYQEQRKHLEAGEGTRKFFHRLHRDSAGIMQFLVDRYAARRQEIASNNPVEIEINNRSP